MRESTTTETGSTDRRIRKTRAALKAGLIQLLSKKRINDISVRELTELADVNRGTFYLHYRDVFDLLEQAEEDLLEEFNDTIKTYTLDVSSPDSMQFFEAVYCFCKDNADFIRILIGENGDIKFLNHLKELIKNKCLTDWSFITKNQRPEDFDPHYAFIVGGCLNLLQYWFACGMHRTPHELAQLTKEILSGGLSMTVQKNLSAGSVKKR